MLSALVSGALALAGIAAGSIVTAESAQAAAGDPFPAADPLVFVAQNQPTGLFKAVTDSTGTVSFQAEGPASAITYNSIAYNTANNSTSISAASTSSSGRGTRGTGGKLVFDMTSSFAVSMWGHGRSASAPRPPA